MKDESAKRGREKTPYSVTGKGPSLLHGVLVLVFHAGGFLAFLLHASVVLNAYPRV